MVTSSFISEIRSELASIEQLISILQRQADFCSRLSSLQYTEPTSLPVGATHSVNPSPGCSTWASVVKGKNRHSLPLYDSQDDSTDLELSNPFAPLADVPTSPSPLLIPFVKALPKDKLYVTLEAKAVGLQVKL